jgi:hypothetical protein
MQVLKNTVPFGAVEIADETDDPEKGATLFSQRILRAIKVYGCHFTLSEARA